MRRTGLSPRAWLVVLGALWAGSAQAQMLTADRAVQLALQKNMQIVQADASVLEARGGLYSAWSGLLPGVSAGMTFNDSRTTNETGFTQFAGTVVPVDPNDSKFSSRTPSLSASWTGLRFSNWSNYRSASSGLAAASRSRDATRAEVALTTRRQFYEVVKAAKLQDVAEGALRLSRDDERRVNALFEVGSVSRSDLLKARVRSSQSELDLLNARHNVLTQRNVLAGMLGLREAAMDPVDTLLSTSAQTFDEAALQAEAGRSHPDLAAARMELQAARANRMSARLARLPYVVAQGSIQYSPTSDFTTTDIGSGLSTTGKNENDRTLQGQIALRWDVFDGFASDARNASANARLRRAEENHAAVERNLAGDVHLAVLEHQKALEQANVAQRGLESATENLKLTQEKYNVGSATILELIDAQVQLQRAQSDGVNALAAIRVAEAQINRVRGRAE